MNLKIYSTNQNIKYKVTNGWNLENSFCLNKPLYFGLSWQDPITATDRIKFLLKKNSTI